VLRLPVFDGDFDGAFGGVEEVGGLLALCIILLNLLADVQLYCQRSERNCELGKE